MSSYNFLNLFFLLRRAERGDGVQYPGRICYPSVSPISLYLSWTRRHVLMFVQAVLVVLLLHDVHDVGDGRTCKPETGESDTASTLRSAEEEEDRSARAASRFFPLVLVHA